MATALLRQVVFLVPISCTAVAEVCQKSCDPPCTNPWFNCPRCQDQLGCSDFGISNPCNCVANCDEACKPDGCQCGTKCSLVCTHCLDGWKYQVNVGVHDQAYVKKNEACGFALVNPEANGIFNGAGDGAWWNLGGGDLIHDKLQSCPKALGNLSAFDGSGSTWTHDRHVPTVLSDGKLRGEHQQLNLGRPGRCKADLLVRLAGDVVGGPFGGEHSAGTCCDRCSASPTCQGWTMDLGECTLMANISKYEACASCVSGQAIGANFGDASKSIVI